MDLSANHTTSPRRPATPVHRTAAPDRATSNVGKTVLQVLPTLSGYRGFERDAVEIAAALVANGDRAIVASTGGPLAHAITRAGAQHLTLPLGSASPLTLLANANRLADIVRSENVDILHARSNRVAASAWWAARRTGCQFVTTFHEICRSGRFLDRRADTFLAMGERVIAVSRFIAAHVRRIYGVSESRVSVVPRGIDLDRFNPARITADRIVALANRWRLADGYPVVMLVGEIAEARGYKVLVNAIGKLGRRDIHCLLMGCDGANRASRASVEALIVERDLGGIVRIVEQCDDIAAAYMLSDVVVSPSVEPEAFGRSLIEAQAIGRPVIASDHGGPRETVIAGRTGWLTPPGDADSLAAAINTAIDLAPDARERLVETAAAHVREHYSKEVMCRATLGIYDEVKSAKMGA